MIKCLSDEFDIYLACLSDEQVSYHDWLEVKAYVKQIAVEKRTRMVKGLARALCTGKSVTEEAHSCAALRLSIEKWVSQVKFDAGLAVCSSMGEYLRELDIERKIVDLIDLDSMKWGQYAQSSRGVKQWLYEREAQLVREKEIEIGSWADGVVLISEAEADDAVNKLKMGRPAVIPNGVEMPKKRSLQIVEHDRFHVVFTGVMDYGPNVEGVKWFVDEVWGGVRAKYPQAEFTIVGSAPTQEVKALDGVDGVHVTGWVKDVQLYLDRADAVVAPLFTARGMQNKVLQAMSAGRAVVVSPQARTGLKAVVGRDLIVARTGKQWVESLCQLAGDRDQAVKIGRSGYEYVAAHHDWGRCMAALVALLKGEAVEPEAEIAGHIEHYAKVSQAA